MALRELFQRAALKRPTILKQHIRYKFDARDIFKVELQLSFGFIDPPSFYNSYLVIPPFWALIFFDRPLNFPTAHQSINEQPLPHCEGRGVQNWEEIAHF